MKLHLLFLACCMSLSTLSAQIFVDASASGANDGTSWANAYTELQYAILNATAGDTLWVRQGTYHPSIDTLGNLPSSPESRSIWLKNGVVVYGGFNGTETTLDQRDPVNLKATLDGQIDTSRAAHVLHVYSGIDSTAILDGFIVTRGKTTATSMTQSGGGMLLLGDAHFYNIDFVFNEAYHHGAGVYAVSSSSLFVSCRFEDNATALYDGAAANLVYSDIRMYNCLYIGNVATRFGGAITTVESDLTVQNGTFVDNDGGSNVFQFSTSGNINLNNCIFTADNAGLAIVGTSGATYNFRECLMPMDTDWTIMCPLCFSGTPTFTNAAGGDYSLLTGSMGIDETLVTAPVNDYDDIAGNPRLVGTSMDLGAYENQTVTSINRADAMPSLVIYPCPAVATLSVQLTEQPQSIAIYNAAGTLVQTEIQSTFLVEHLPAGLYLLEVRTKSGISRGRFVKE